MAVGHNIGHGKLLHAAGDGSLYDPDISDIVGSQAVETDLIAVFAA